ncbi:hypothetical protein BDU57DRAFT_597589 [Ampelomyces quisqualis]|uniref:Uncharacterized protein n=1 Tax=Ampelomyces quisqualis TaxID=50730 RepID=A0A6A5QCX5_AMPQU|nr:hypothetical protein BDU57DRAFT_597589 [Ampelomyces quisqualis]
MPAVNLPSTTPRANTSFTTKLNILCSCSQCTFFLHPTLTSPPSSALPPPPFPPPPPPTAPRHPSLAPSTPPFSPFNPKTPGILRCTAPACREPVWVLELGNKLCGAHARGLRESIGVCFGMVGAEVRG